MNNEQRQRLLLLIAGLAVGILVADRLVLTPLTEFWNQRSERIASLRQSVSQGTLLLEREGALRERWQSMLDNSLPNDPSEAEGAVLKSFERWSRDSRISLASVKPLWNPVDTNYMTLEYRADGFGNIESITRFLYELEKDPLAFRVHTMSIAAKDKDGGQLSLSLHMSGLVLDPYQP